MWAHLEEIAGATGDIEGTAALIIDQAEEFQIYPEKNIFSLRNTVPLLFGKHLPC